MEMLDEVFKPEFSPGNLHFLKISAFFSPGILNIMPYPVCQRILLGLQVISCAALACRLVEPHSSSTVFFYP